jgi:hypothetical protein
MKQKNQMYSKSDSEALRRNRISDVELGAIIIYNEDIAIVNVTKIKKNGHYTT